MSEVISTVNCKNNDRIWAFPSRPTTDPLQKMLLISPRRYISDHLSAANFIQSDSSTLLLINMHILISAVMAAPPVQTGLRLFFSL